jgi:nucleoside-diphosphate-sugar epimerase
VAQHQWHPGAGLRRDDVAKVSLFGYGAVGRETAWMLSGRGDAVRVVQRTEPKPLPARCTFQASDVTDRDATIRACAGADTVFCCIGLPYDSAVWRRTWPQAMTNLIDGCSAAGARLVFADNLYMYGPQNRPLVEDMPLTEYGRKPAIRSEVTRLWKAAHDSGRVRAVAVRAADFYGPDVATSVIAAYGVARYLARKPALSPYYPDYPHDFDYVPDVARALVTLGDAADDAYGQAWHVPHAPTQTLRAVLTQAANLIGVPPRITVVPRAVVALGGLFNSQMRETLEMGFQWDHPYLVDASKFRARFWSDATSFEDGLSATIASYRNR